MNRSFLTLVSIAIFSAFLFISCSLSKDSDDETIYASLAVKIQATGFQAYNLHDLTIDPAGKFWKLRYERGDGLLSLLEKSGVTYYDVPLHFQPPLFPAFLSASHKIFNGSGPFLLFKKGQAPEFRYEQLYAAVPNVLFCLLFLLGVFFLGNNFFDQKTGILAALFCFVSPVFLVCTFKAWSDLMAATLVLWSFLHWQKKNSTFHVLFSGILFGLALLTRTSSFFAIPIFMTRNWRSFLVWVAAFILTTGAWFISVYRVYGEIFYHPEAKGAKESLSWLAAISRPWYVYPLNLVYLSPCFAPVVIINKHWKIFWIWILSFLVPLSILLYAQRPLGLEDRYLLSCYPAFAILSAAGFVKIAKVVPQKILLGIILFGCAWSLKLSILLVHSRESLLFTPW